VISIDLSKAVQNPFLQNRRSEITNVATMKTITSLSMKSFISSIACGPGDRYEDASVEKYFPTEGMDNCAFVTAPTSATINKRNRGL